MATARRGPVEQAIWRDLSVSERRSALGQASLLMGRQLDGGEVDDRDIATLNRELRANLAELARSRPVAVPEEDPLAKRRARRAATRGTG